MSYLENKALFSAVFRSNLNDLLKALDSGIAIDARDDDKRTVLMHASIDKQLEMVKALVERGANINAKDSQDMTALHFAAQNYDLPLCKYLIMHGAEIDAKDDNGNSPLWRAEFNSQGAEELQNFFIENGANENLSNNFGVSPKDLKDG